MEGKVNFTIMPDPESEARCCNSAICKECKGYGCCQGSGCALAPSDVYVLAHEFSKKERVKYLINLLKRGDLSIDHKTMRDPEMGAYKVIGSIFNPKNITVSRERLLAGYGVLYLRARNKGKKIVDIIHYNWEPDGPCASWSLESGCKFSFAKRPKGGRMLIPDPLGLSCENCIAKYDEVAAAKEWLEFQDIMYEVFTFFKSRDM